MNGTGEVTNNKFTITVVTLTLAVNATIGMGTLAYCMLTEKKPDVALFTAFVAIVNYILGVISGMLIKSSPTSSTQDVKVTNPPTEPVPTEVQGQNQQL